MAHHSDSYFTTQFSLTHSGEQQMGSAHTSGSMGKARCVFHVQTRALRLSVPLTLLSPGHSPNWLACCYQPGAVTAAYCHHLQPSSMLPGERVSTWCSEAVCKPMLAQPGSQTSCHIFGDQSTWVHVERAIIQNELSFLHSSSFSVCQTPFTINSNCMLALVFLHTLFTFML